MITRVNVVAADEWDDYIEQKARIIDELAEDLYPCYAAKRIYPRCKSCHSLDGTDITGPSFKGLWDRTTRGEQVYTDGSTLSDLMGPGKMFDGPDDYILQSITNPQQLIRANFTGAMPTFQGQLRPKEIEAMLMFLKDPYKVVDEKGNLIVDCDF